MGVTDKKMMKNNELMKNEWNDYNVRRIGLRLFDIATIYEIYSE